MLRIVGQNWTALRGAIFSNKVLDIVGCRDVHQFNEHPKFPNVEKLFLRGCDNIFTCYWLRPEVFPQVKEVYASSAIDHEVLQFWLRYKTAIKDDGTIPDVVIEQGPLGHSRIPPTFYLERRFVEYRKMDLYFNSIAYRKFIKSIDDGECEKMLGRDSYINQIRLEYGSNKDGTNTSTFVYSNGQMY